MLWLKIDLILILVEWSVLRQTWLILVWNIKESRWLDKIVRTLEWSQRNQYCNPVALLTSYQNWWPVRGNPYRLKIEPRPLNGRFSSIRRPIRSFQASRWTKNTEGVGCKKMLPRKTNLLNLQRNTAGVCLDNLAPRSR